MTVVVEGPLASFAQFLDQRRAVGLDRFDYQLGDRYLVVPPPALAHQRLVGRIVGALSGLQPASVLPQAGLGVIPPRIADDQRGWYVIPDVIVTDRITDSDTDGVAVVSALLAIEVRSPGESLDAKLGDYRTVASNIPSLVVGELWHIDQSARSISVVIGPLLAGARTTTVALGAAGGDLEVASTYPGWLRAVLDLL